jgi:RNA recognition motif-containing protein
VLPQIPPWQSAAWGNTTPLLLQEICTYFGPVEHVKVIKVRASPLVGSGIGGSPRRRAAGAAGAAAGAASGGRLGGRPARARAQCLQPRGPVPARPAPAHAPAPGQRRQDKATGVSAGYGFARFADRRYALVALQYLNVSPRTKRPLAFAGAER